MTTTSYNTQFSTWPAPLDTSKVALEAPLDFYVPSDIVPLETDLSHSERRLLYQLAKLELIFQEGKFDDWNILTILDLAETYVKEDQRLLLGYSSFFTWGRIHKTLLLTDEAGFGLELVNRLVRLPLHEDARAYLQRMLLLRFRATVIDRYRKGITDRPPDVPDFKYQLALLSILPITHTLEFLNGVDYSSLSLYRLSIDHLEKVVLTTEVTSREIEKDLVCLLGKLVHSEYFAVPPSATQINNMLDLHKLWSTVLVHRCTKRLEVGNYKYHLFGPTQREMSLREVDHVKQNKPKLPKVKIGLWKKWCTFLKKFIRRTL